MSCRENYRAKEVTEIIFDKVCKYHGTRDSIVSDRHKWFTSTLWEHLSKLVGPKLNISSSYHPDSDGVTERANKTVTQMIRQCIGKSQKDWVSTIPGIEFR
jgi:hypothetical protein